MIRTWARREGAGYDHAYALTSEGQVWSWGLYGGWCRMSFRWSSSPPRTGRSPAPCGHPHGREDSPQERFRTTRRRSLPVRSFRHSETIW
ncbi:RCC1-like domain-containing protein [Streptomyces huasconensis]|uniref:RCC1-like domain-containing protein n=1 Tax=Streptomyces TaxID=1883 RepID=UPI0038B4932D|nr:hypothetical protein J2N69_35905 [Streptomyces huasconensis]